MEMLEKAIEQEGVSSDDIVAELLLQTRDGRLVWVVENMHKLWAGLGDVNFYLYAGNNGGNSDAQTVLSSSNLKDYACCVPLQTNGSMVEELWKIARSRALTIEHSFFRTNDPQLGRLWSILTSGRPQRVSPEILEILEIDPVLEW
jgi:hypothetical protein